MRHQEEWQIVQRGFDVTAHSDDAATHLGERPSARAVAKQEKILDAAWQVFMDRGFEGASMDEIVRISGVSKPTLYRYFPDKRHLYSAIFTRECDRYAAQLFPPELDAADVAEALEQIARLYLKRLLSPQAQSAFRLAVGGALQFPDLARAFYATGPARGARHLEPLLSNFVARGDLEIDDIPLAAAQFLELCKADQFYKKVLAMIDTPAPAEIDRVAKGAVKVFMRAYGAQRQD